MEVLVTYRISASGREISGVRDVPVDENTGKPSDYFWDCGCYGWDRGRAEHITDLCEADGISSDWIPFDMISQDEVKDEDGFRIQARVTWNGEVIYSDFDE